MWSARGWVLTVSSLLCIACAQANRDGQPKLLSPRSAPGRAAACGIPELLHAEFTTAPVFSPGSAF
jgi:hypothetical protein